MLAASALFAVLLLQAAMARASLTDAARCIAATVPLPRCSRDAPCSTAGSWQTFDAPSAHLCQTMPRPLEDDWVVYGTAAALRAVVRDAADANDIVGHWNPQARCFAAAGTCLAANNSLSDGPRACHGDSRLQQADPARDRLLAAASDMDKLAMALFFQNEDATSDRRQAIVASLDVLSARVRDESPPWPLTSCAQAVIASVQGSLGNATATDELVDACRAAITALARDAQGLACMQATVDACTSDYSGALVPLDRCLAQQAVRNATLVDVDNLATALVEDGQVPTPLAIDPTATRRPRLSHTGSTPLVVLNPAWLGVGHRSRQVTYECGTGYFRDNGACTGCPVGTFCPGDELMHQCSNAPTSGAEYTQAYWPHPTCPFRCTETGKFQTMQTCIPIPTGWYSPDGKTILRCTVDALLGNGRLEAFLADNSNCSTYYPYPLVAATDAPWSTGWSLDIDVHLQPSRPAAVELVAALDAWSLDAIVGTTNDSQTAPDVRFLLTAVPGSQAISRPLALTGPVQLRVDVDAAQRLTTFYANDRYLGSAVLPVAELPLASHLVLGRDLPRTHYGRVRIVTGNAQLRMAPSDDIPLRADTIEPCIGSPNAAHRFEMVGTCTCRSGFVATGSGSERCQACGRNTDGSSYPRLTADDCTCADGFIADDGQCVAERAALSPPRIDMEWEYLGDDGSVYAPAHAPVTISQPNLAAADRQSAVLTVRLFDGDRHEDPPRVVVQTPLDRWTFNLTNATRIEATMGGRLRPESVKTAVLLRPLPRLPKVHLRPPPGDLDTPSAVIMWTVAGPELAVVDYALGDDSRRPCDPESSSVIVRPGATLHVQAMPVDPTRYAPGPLARVEYGIAARPATQPAGPVAGNATTGAASSFAPPPVASGCGGTCTALILSIAFIAAGSLAAAIVLVRRRRAAAARRAVRRRRLRRARRTAAQTL